MKRLLTDYELRCLDRSSIESVIYLFKSAFRSSSWRIAMRSGDILHAESNQDTNDYCSTLRRTIAARSSDKE